MLPCDKLLEVAIHSEFVRTGSVSMVVCGRRVGVMRDRVHGLCATVKSILRRARARRYVVGIGVLVIAVSALPAMGDEPCGEHCDEVPFDSQCFQVEDSPGVPLIHFHYAANNEPHVRLIRRRYEDDSSTDDFPPGQALCTWPNGKPVKVYGTDSRLHCAPTGSGRYKYLWRFDEDDDDGEWVEGDLGEFYLNQVLEITDLEVNYDENEGTWSADVGYRFHHVGRLGREVAVFCVDAEGNVSQAPCSADWLAVGA